MFVETEKAQTQTQVALIGLATRAPYTQVIMNFQLNTRFPSTDVSNQNEPRLLSANLTLLPLFFFFNDPFCERFLSRLNEDRKRLFDLFITSYLLSI